MIFLGFLLQEAAMAKLAASEAATFVSHQVSGDIYSESDKCALIIVFSEHIVKKMPHTQHLSLNSYVLISPSITLPDSILLIL